MWQAAVTIILFAAIIAFQCYKFRTSRIRECFIISSRHALVPAINRLDVPWRRYPSTIVCQIDATLRVPQPCRPCRPCRPAIFSGILAAKIRVVSSLMSTVRFRCSLVVIDMGQRELSCIELSRLRRKLWHSAIIAMWRDVARAMSPYNRYPRLQIYSSCWMAICANCCIKIVMF